MYNTWVQSPVFFCPIQLSHHIAMVLESWCSGFCRNFHTTLATYSFYFLDILVQKVTLRFMFTFILKSFKRYNALIYYYYLPGKFCHLDTRKVQRHWYFLYIHRKTRFCISFILACICMVAFLGFLRSF